MKLTIITINYNNAQGLEKTISSVLSQSRRDIEYIVIDGGSADGSLDVLKHFSGQLSHWVSEPDKGIYHAMNKGIRAACGEYCLFLNSGDFLHGNDALEQLFLHGFTEDIVSCSTINTDGKVHFLKTPPSQISFYSFIGASLPHPSTLIKRTLFDTVGPYREDYQIISDWAFFIEALVTHQASYRMIELPLSVFDRSGASISTNNPERIRQETDDFLQQHFPRVYKDYSIPEYCCNTFYYLLSSTSNSFLKKMLLLQCRIINRIFKLRNRLGKKISLNQLKSWPD